MWLADCIARMRNASDMHEYFVISAEPKTELRLRVTGYVPQSLHVYRGRDLPP